MNFKWNIASLECASFRCPCGSGQFVIQDNGFLYCSNCGMPRI